MEFSQVHSAALDGMIPSASEEPQRRRENPGQA